MKRVLGLALATVLLVPASVSAQDDGCVVKLWDYPFEELALPDGWSVTDFQPGPTGTVTLELTGPVMGEGSFGLEPAARITVGLACVADAAAFHAALVRAEALADPRNDPVASTFRDRREVPVARIGDETRATVERDEPTDYNVTTETEIRWTHGPVVGSLYLYQDDFFEGEVPWGDIAAIALAVDALLD